MSADCTARTAALAVEALHVELALAPKPGLVTPSSRGSHEDMDARSFAASIGALAPYFADCVALGRGGAAFAELQARGLQAEGQMLQATGGVNTHRGAIFVLGLLCAAAGVQGRERGRVYACELGAVVRSRWAAELAKPLSTVSTVSTSSTTNAASLALAISHGERVRQRYGLGGARAQAQAGFPVLFACSLPNLRAALRRGATPAQACTQALLQTMAVLDDTNVVHRGGPQALDWVQQQARQFLHAGGVYRTDWRSRLQALGRQMQALRLSPGGSADLLAAAWFLHRCTPAHGRPQGARVAARPILPHRSDPRPPALHESVHPVSGAS